MFDRPEARLLLTWGPHSEWMFPRGFWTELYRLDSGVV
jgi:hypothetical protein